MKRNFEIDGFSAIRWRDRLIDLHNVYDVERFGTDLRGSEVQLSFRRNQYATDTDRLPAGVMLTCTGNVRVAFNDLCLLAAPLADEGIDIAYFDADCDWRSFLDEEIASRQEPLGLHLSFNNGLAIRIYCDETSFHANET